MDTRVALDIARQEGLDLVEVSPNDRPPVCLIIDYGKFQYEKKKKQRANKSKEVEWKELRLTPGTGENDIHTKVRQARKFLEQGKYIKVTVRFRSRQLAHTDEGQKVLDRIVQEVSDIAAAESRSRMEGKQLSLHLIPKTND